MKVRLVQRTSLSLLPLLDIYLILLVPGHVIATTVGVFQHKPGGVAVGTSYSRVLARARVTDSIVQTDVFYVTVSVAVVAAHNARRPVVQNSLRNLEVSDSSGLDGMICVVRHGEFNDNRGLFLARSGVDKPAHIYDLAGLTPRVIIVGHEFLRNPLAVRVVDQQAQSPARHVSGDHLSQGESDPCGGAEVFNSDVSVCLRDLHFLDTVEEEPQII
ncbi:hypothetical protein BDV41DRAFT_541039 [Aspergillus transmontanensis]|uniref:Uncharacterized protein n=1 Tax=Aspergillus transmontanensis TaxID=1034304 RepID=A0A5N6VU41_9EURO|nr:hypothetical protein BDV41DRAFT_541039 [Aspergillus transmontanensis]